MVFLRSVKKMFLHIVESAAKVKNILGIKESACLKKVYKGPFHDLSCPWRDDLFVYGNFCPSVIIH